MSNENIEALALEEQRKYHKEWRKNNKDKVREINKRYWLKKAKANIENSTKE